jgi:hypothetical protein
MSAAPLDQFELARVEAPFGQNLTLPGGAYISEEVFHWEMDNIFRST